MRRVATTHIMWREFDLHWHVRELWDGLSTIGPSAAWKMDGVRPKLTMCPKGLGCSGDLKSFGENRDWGTRGDMRTFGLGIGKELERGSKSAHKQMEKSNIMMSSRPVAEEERLGNSCARLM